MKLSAINLAELPVIPVRKGMVVDSASLSELANVGTGLVSFGVNPNDTIEFPETEADIKLQKRQVRPNSTSYEYLLAVVKNGKPAWFSLGNLNRRDAHNKPVHPVAESLAELANQEDRLIACLGKTIKGAETIEYDQRDFSADGVRLDTISVKKTTKLVFA